MITKLQLVIKHQNTMPVNTHPVIPIIALVNKTNQGH